MSFCEFSNEVISKNSISIDNLFVTDFLPNASENCVKIYLYGLYLCGNSRDNTIETFMKVFDMTQEDILSVFYYWQEQGLVQVINVEPIIIRYLPIKNAARTLKKYNVDKYAAFNISAQELMGSKMLTPREFEEFYYLIENLHMEKDAVLRVIDYATKQKGKNVSINYVTTIAKNWAYDGVRTVEDVEERIAEQDRVSGDVILLLKAMGFRRQATIAEYKLFLDWTKGMEWEISLLVLIAKNSKCKSFETLNDLVVKLYSYKLSSEKEINDYFEGREKMFALAKNVVKNLGLWYADLNGVVDEYITNWLQLGFEESALLKLSNYAFKSSIRTLEMFDVHVKNMFKAGILTSEALDNHLLDIVKNDTVIANIIEKLGIVRSVNSQDRMFYKAWVFDWKLSEEIINYAVDLAKDKYMPMQYLNKILASYHGAGVASLDDCKRVVVEVAKSSPKVESKKEAKHREYTTQELESLFDNIEEVEI